MSFISYIFNCWPSSPTQYELLSKKDDDFGMDALKAWKESYPINPELTNLSSERIKDHVSNLIKDLNNVPITSSNVDSIKKHLVETSKQSGRVRQQLINEISNIKTKEEWIRFIKSGVIFTYTNKL